MTRTMLAFASIVLALPALASHASAQFGGASAGRIEVSLVWHDGPPAAGDTGVLGILLDVDDRWHIQAGAGSGDEQLPYSATTIGLELPEGWTTGDIYWPDAHTFTLGTGKYKESLKGYDGVTLAAVRVRAPANADAGPHDITAEIGFQACDDSVCEMPTTTVVTASFTIGTTNPLPEEVMALFTAVMPGPEPARAESDPPDDDTPPIERSDPFAGGSGNEVHRLVAELAWYEVRLIAGRDATLAIVLDLEDGWHAQAGLDSGDDQEPYIPTSIDLELPEGWTAGDVQWPTAHEFVLGKGELSQTLWGYTGRAAVVISVTVPADAAVGEYEISATIEYQACNDQICEAPTDVTVVGTAIVIDEGDPVPALDQATTRLVETTLARTASSASDSAAKADAKAKAAWIGKTRWWVAFGLVAAAMLWMIVRAGMISKSMIKRGIVLVIGALVIYGTFTFVRGITSAQSASGQTIPWVAYTEAGFDDAVAADNRVLIKFTADWCANCQVNESLILASDEAVDELNEPDLVTFKVDFTGAHPDGDKKKAELGGGGIPLIAVYLPASADPIVIRGQIASAQPVIDALRGKSRNVGDGRWFDFLNWGFSVDEDAVLLIFAIAMVAGFFMNFTPCVLPVIPLKILSLQAHAKNPRRCFMLGLVFGIGIIAFYAILGVFMAGLISGIERLDWGEMFQHWYVTGPIGILIGGMAIGLLGVFTIRLPQFLYMFNPQSDTVKGSFFMGMFTALLSTPCTGPLLGATIAWTAVQPSSIAFLTLLLMGVGMAFPYVLLTAKPAWLDRMPKAGPGSALVKEVMGLLLLAVGVWFVGTAAVAFVV